METLERGWPKGKPELSAWLDAMCQDNWMAELTAVPDLPLGVLDDPRRLTMNSRLDKLQPARLLALVLMVRGLQQQAAGHDEVFADNLRIGLAVSRNLQHDSPLLTTLVGRAMESVCLSGLERWLEKLRGHPQLLKRVLRTLLRHEAELPDELQPLQAEYLSALNTLEETPEQLVQMGIEDRGNKDDPLRQTEIQGAALAWLFPWEQERHRRILRVNFQGDLHQRRQAREWGGVLSDLSFRSDRLSRPKRGLSRLRASQLQVALRLYQADTGKPAATLDALVPRVSAGHSERSVRRSAVPLSSVEGRTHRLAAAGTGPSSRSSSAAASARPSRRACRWDAGHGRRNAPCPRASADTLGAQGTGHPLVGRRGYAR